MSLTIRTLQHDDAARLLEFELRNRAWFERFIEARDETAYTSAGIALHINDYLRDFAAGHLHPCIALQGGQIIGRGNLKNIDRASSSAELGYRVAADAAGRGHASAILGHLLRLAKHHWQLTHVHAYASDANPASSRVLEKQGFHVSGTVPQLLVLHGAWQSGRRHTLALA